MFLSREGKFLGLARGGGKLLSFILLSASRRCRNVRGSCCEASPIFALLEKFDDEAGWIWFLLKPIKSACLFAAGRGLNSISSHLNAKWSIHL